jgi:hypothetical protein
LRFHPDTELGRVATALRFEPSIVARTPMKAVLDTASPQS